MEPGACNVNGVWNFEKGYSWQPANTDVATPRIAICTSVHKILQEDRADLSHDLVLVQGYPQAASLFVTVYLKRGDQKRTGT